MIRKLLRVMLALVLAGAVPMLLFIAKYGTDHYFNYLVVLTPVILALSLPIGGLFYVALRALHVRLSVPICIVTGAVVGSLPGILLWSLPHPGASQTQIEDFRTYPSTFGMFGAVGGLTFAAVGRLLKVR